MVYGSGHSFIRSLVRSFVRLFISSIVFDLQLYIYICFTQLAKDYKASQAVIVLICLFVCLSVGLGYSVYVMPCPDAAVCHRSLRALCFTRMVEDKQHSSTEPRDGVMAPVVFSRPCVVSAAVVCSARPTCCNPVYNLIIYVYINLYRGI